MRQALVGGVDGGLLAGVVADADGMLLLLWSAGAYWGRTAVVTDRREKEM